MNKLRVGSCIAEAGRLTTGVIHVTEDPAGGSVEIPILVLSGKSEGPTLWINGGIHGDEPQGAWAIFALLKEVDPESLQGAIIAAPFMNVPAFESRARGNPLDPFAYDMNRLYPGSESGRLTQRIAWAHCQELLQTADLEISVHSGGAECYLERTVFATDSSLELAKAMGPNWGLILESFQPSGTPMAALLAKGIPAISIEQGGGAPSGQEALRDIRILLSAFMNVLRHYGMISGTAEYSSEWRHGKSVSVLSQHSGVWIPEPGIEFHKPYERGRIAGRVVNLYGETLEEIQTPCDGEVFGIRALPVVHTGEWMLFYAAIQNTSKA